MPRLIDADAAMQEVLRRCNEVIVKYKTMRHALGDVARAAIEAVKAVPTLNYEPVKHGSWIEDCMDVICSNCRTAFRDEIKFILLDPDFIHPKRCPECGAYMDGDIEVAEHGN